MPTESNPWSGELKAKRQKSRESNKGKTNPANSQSVSQPPKHSNPVRDNGIEPGKNNQPTTSELSNTQDMIKQTRKNLRPVSQPLKRSDSVKDDGEESHVERLLRQGSLVDSENNFRDKGRKRKESEEYLMVNFPVDVRKNLKGIILPDPDDQSKTDEDKNSKDNNNEVKVVNKSDEGNLSQGRETALLD